MTANAPAKPEATVERTEHPHIVKSEGTLGGEPRIENTRISALLIFDMHIGGISTAEILQSYPDLSLGQIHDAIIYGYDHPDEMGFHRERHKLRSILRDTDSVLVNSRLIPRSRLRADDIPPGATIYTWESLPPQEDE